MDYGGEYVDGRYVSTYDDDYYELVIKPREVEEKEEELARVMRARKTLLIQLAFNDKPWVESVFSSYVHKDSYYCISSYAWKDKENKRMMVAGNRNMYLKQMLEWATAKGGFF